MIQSTSALCLMFEGGAWYTHINIYIAYLQDKIHP